MKRVVVPCLIFIAAFWSCQSIENAEPASRKTFIRVFEGGFSYTAIGMDSLVDGNGHVILGTTPAGDGTIQTILMRIDAGGHLIGDIIRFSEGIGKAIKSYPGGYIIACDSIKIDPNASVAGNIEVSSMYLKFFDTDFQPNGTFTIKDPTPNTPANESKVRTDIKSNAVTIADDGKILVLGTTQDNLAPQKPFVIALNTNHTLAWRDDFEILDLDFVNAKSMHYSNGHIIWASSILKQQGSFDEAYITIPYVQESLTFANNSTYGEDVVQALFANDIQPAAVKSSGYGVIGTIGATNGTGKDIFFARVSTDGTINPSAVALIDGAAGLVKDATITSEDTGDALTSSKEGGFILSGTLFTNTSLGKGSRDVLLVRVDSFGEVIWKKLIGGSGDETVCAVKETKDGGILITGTNNVAGYSSIFVIKTDKHGELAN